MEVAESIASLGGVASTHELIRRGATSHRLTREVRSGQIVRIRQGWYGLPDARPVPTAAVRVGGRATCLSAAVELGLWSFPSTTVHVRVDPRSARLRLPDDHRRRLSDEMDASVRVHWIAGGGGGRETVDALACLIDMIGCQSPERVVAAADSALRRGLISRREWNRAVRSAPRRLRPLLSRVDPRSESIIESLMRFRLRALGFIPRVQVTIPRVGRVDLVLGDRLVIELDGWEHHKTREQFEEDRRRDAELARRGYRVLRFTYRALTRQWHRVLAVVRACAAQTSLR